MRLSSIPVMIALTIILTGVFPGGQSFAENANQITMRNDFIHNETDGTIPQEGLKLLSDKDGRGSRATIVLNAGATLLANTDALDAFNRAIDVWAIWFDDPVTIVIEADLTAQGGGGPLGEMMYNTFDYTYTSVRDQMVADATVDETICNSLPTLAQLALTIPNGFWFSDNMTATKANLRALGYDMSFDDPNPDVIINLNNDRISEFDFDRTDGIDPNKFDFEGVVLHEIGHAFGFNSRVERIDGLLSPLQPEEVKPNPLDLFRLEPGQGLADFTTSPRILIPGNPTPPNPQVPDQVTYDGSDDIMMSTGSLHGDGQGASHWKDDALSGSHIGLMDPTMGCGDQVKPLEKDIRTLGLIGWDVGQGPCQGETGDCNQDGFTWDILDLTCMINYLIWKYEPYPTVPNPCGFEMNSYDNPFYPCEPTFGDMLHLQLRFTHGLDILNQDCRFTIFPEESDLAIVMPHDIDLSTDLTTSFPIMIQNTGIDTKYIWAITSPVHFSVSGGTGTATATASRIRAFDGSWSGGGTSVSDEKPVAHLFGTEPVRIFPGQSLGIYQINYQWTYSSGTPAMTGEFFTAPPAFVPLVSVSPDPGTMPTEEILQVIHANCIPGEPNKTSPIDLLDILFIIQYKYQSGPDPEPYALCSGDANCDCNVDILDILLLIGYKYKYGSFPCNCQDWIDECGLPLRE